MEPWHYLLLAGLGLVAGTLNVLAGGGSLLTLPALVFLGLDGPVANGTNRVAILAQNLVAIGGFRARGFSDFRLSLTLALATLPGAVAGAWLGTLVRGDLFNRILGIILVAVLVHMAVERHRKRRRSTGFQPADPRQDQPADRRQDDPTDRRQECLRHPEDPAKASALAETSGPQEALASGAEESGAPIPRPSPIPKSRWLLGHLCLVVVGFYGGFIQAGVGFLLMAALHQVMGLDLVRVNMHKVFVVGAFTLVALAVFAAKGQVLWIPGAALAAGNALGGWIGSQISVTKGESWIRAALYVALLAMAGKLLLG